MASDDSSQPLLGTAAWHATRNVPIAAPDDEADEVLHGMRGKPFDTAAVIAVCEQGRLAGLVAIERLLAAAGTARMRDLMDPDPPRVEPGLGQEPVAWKAVTHGELAVAVVDEGDRFAGVIPGGRLLRVLLVAHDRDLALRGGYLQSRTQAATAAEEGVWRRLWHRIPWLAFGLAGAMLSAKLLEGSQARLETQVAVAFFLPGIVYLADAVGTQTETLAIRGLTVGVGIRRIAGRESLTGVLVGLLLAALVFPAVVLWQGEVWLAAAVALAVLVASALATTVAMALPWLLQRLGRDPAFGSGPVATVVQDILSIAIYLAFVTLFVGR